MLSTNTQFEKNNHSACLIIHKEARNSTKKVICPTYFWLFSHFMFLFSHFSFFFLATRHILQFTMFDLISLQPAHNITKIKITSQSTTQEKVLHYQTKCLNIIILGIQYEFFLPPYQVTFFFVFGQDKDQKSFFSYYILVNILSTNYYGYFMTKKYLNNISYTNLLSLTCKQHSKIRKEHVFNKIYLFNNSLSYFYTARIWQNLITSKASKSSYSQMFYKIDVLEYFAKFTGKHLCWSHFLIKLQA